LIKYGIDWTKIALEVNDERKKAIRNGTKPADAFNAAYRAVTALHPEITGEAWKEGRSIVGTILAGWKKEKDQATKAKRVAQVKPVARVAKKKPDVKKAKHQGELDL